MLEARRYRAHLTDEQAARAVGWLHTHRALWNLALEQRDDDWKRSRRSVTRFQQDRELKELRAWFDWIADVPQVAQQQLIKDLDQAYQNWWNNPGHFDHPTRRERGSTAGLRFPAKECKGAPEKLNRRWSRVWIPKLGWLRYRRDRALGGTMRSVTLKRDQVGDWWVSMSVETGVEPAEGRTVGPVVGVDRGVTVSVQASDGRSWQCPTPRRGERQRRLRLERKLARQVKGSNRRERTKRELAKVRRRDQRRRSDFAHKVSAELAADARIVGFEKLNIGAMTASASGTVEEPGTNVAQKRGLNRAILEQGWGLVHQYTGYKSIRTGARVVKVPAPYTSRRCSACGHTEGGNRKSQAVFSCRACGHTSNADVNASINVEQAAGQMVVSARGDLGLPGSVKREPTPGLAA